MRRSSGSSSARTIAIDWSGAQSGARRKIYLAEAQDGDLVRLESGRSREETAAWLIDAASRDRLIVGLDFAFSFPAWFLDRRRFESARDCWRALADGQAETWLRECADPFWGRPGRRCAVAKERRFRRTEQGLPAKSVFQIGGAGAVGTGSLRGMTSLHALATAGFRIWPFDDPRPRHSLAVEIYPRLWSPGVTKTAPAERAAHLNNGRYPALSSEMRRKAAYSEDSFDAAISALAMDGARTQLESLGPVSDPVIRREGFIWTEDWAERLGR